MTKGERVKEIRKVLGLSGEKFGEQLGVSRAAISNIEKGKRDLTDQMFLSICREFNVNEEWLRNGSGEMFIQLDEDEQISSFFNDLLQEENGSFKRQFVTALSHLDDNGWNLLNQFMDFMQNKKDRV